MTDATNPNSYPHYEEDVTAERIARHLTATARHYDAAAEELLDADPHSTEGKLYRALTGAFVNQFAVVYLLRRVAEYDPAGAHALAVDVYRCWEDGGTMHELLWEWAEEYGQHPAQPVPS